MGNICPCCFKTQDDSQSNGNYAAITNSERSLFPSDATEQTRLLGKSDSHNPPVILDFPRSQSNAEASSSSISTIASLPRPPLIITEQNTEPTIISLNDTAETKMAYIVEGMLSKLIDVGNGSSGVLPTNSNINGLNTQNDHLRQTLNKSLSSSRILALPDAGIANLPSLLSGRPISSDICHFVAHTAGELSHLLIDEIKIIHKEELVVIFE